LTEYFMYATIHIF